MSDRKKISELTELATVDKSNDWVPVVDISDTTESPQGTTKKAVVDQFIGETGAPGQDGEDGREIEIQNNGTYVQWRYVGDAAWTNLVALADITGADGTNGTDGREVQLQKGATHIQWKYDDEVTWTDLIAVSELVGATGAPGSDGEDAYVYIAYASDASGTGFTTTFNADLDYIAIKSTNTEIVTPQASDFTGLWKNYKGAQGIQGIQGEQGLPGADGEDGASSYTYIAYASDNSGTGFTTTFDANLDYIAIKTTTSPIASPQASDFVGLWKNYKGERGIQGEPGEDGLDITWRGVYSAETAYVVNDAVYYGGSSYICILASTGNLPTDETYWNLMAQQGAAGEGSGDVTGPDGATDNAIARFDLSTGKIIQNSLVTVDDSGSINIPSGQQYLVNGSPVEGYSDEQAQDAVGGILTDSSEVDFTYDDTTPSITASLKAGAIDESKLDTNVNASLDLADSAVQPGDLATVATSGAYSDLTDKPTIPSTFDDLTDGTTNKAYTATEKTKLFGIAENANNYSHPNHSGDVTSVGDGATTIANGAVTNAKMANMTTKTYKGRTAGTTGAPEDVPVATLKTDLALVKGDVGLGNVDNTSDATKNSAVATLTNKTINADNNTISNLEVDNLKAGVLDTDLSSVSASDDTLPSAKAVKAYVDANAGGGFVWKGPWATSTAYALNDTVENNGSGYICTADHTSGSTTEPGVGASWATVWDLFVEGVSGNSLQVDQSGGTSDTYGVLSGSVNGTNTTFTVSLGSYVSGSLRVYLNGQLQTQGSGEDWVETDPASGTFTFATAPATGDIITAVYQFASSVTGNADTLDGLHASSFVQDTGDETIAGVKTFGDGVATDTIGEETADAGVTVDGVLLKNGNIALGVGGTISGSIYTINDDTAISFTPPVDIGLLFIVGRHTNYDHLSGICTFRTMATNATYPLAAGSGFEVTAGAALTGTTGTDGKLTVSAYSGDGKVYIENRSGGTVSISVNIIGS